MTAYVVYVDVLLALNFCLDFLLLAAAGHFLGRGAPLLRLLAGAGVGAVYGAAMVWPALAVLYLPPVVILVSVGLLLIAYPWRGWADFLKLAAVFYLVAFAMAGSVLAASTWMSSQGYVLGGATMVRWAALISALPVALILGRRGYRALSRAWQRETFRAEVDIEVAGRSCRLSALIDTGNELMDPLSGLPVVVADTRAVAALVPEKVRRLWQEWEDQPDQALRDFSALSDEDGWCRRLRVIPFASIGRSHGTLLGFRPDALRLRYQGETRPIRAMVALSPLSRGQSYQAVINPDLMWEKDSEKEMGA